MKRIAIHSVPRSGSTWLGSIFDSHPNVIYRYQPLFSYAFKGRLDEHASKSDIISFFSDISQSEDDFINQTEAKRKGIVPAFDKAEIKAVVYKEVRYHHIIHNLLGQDEEIKIIGLIRNPLSTLYSWLNAPKEFRSDLEWRVEEEWRHAPSKNQNKPEEFNGYEKWKEVATLFIGLQEQFPNHFYLLKYKDLLAETENSISDIFEFCGLDFPERTRKFLMESKQTEVKDAYGVFKRKNADDDWKKGLHTDIMKYIMSDLEKTVLMQFLE